MLKDNEVEEPNCSEIRGGGAEVLRDDPSRKDQVILRKGGSPSNGPQGALGIEKKSVRVRWTLTGDEEERASWDEAGAFGAF